MNYQELALLLITIIYIFNVIKELLRIASSKNQMPDNVKDIYSLEEFEKWKKYNKENAGFSILCHTIKHIIIHSLIKYDILAYTSTLFDSTIGSSLMVVLAYTLIPYPFEVLFNYVSSMKIEEKYGFNKTTIKTFVFDQIKSLILGCIMNCGIVFIYILLAESFGAKVLFIFAIVLYIIVLAISFLYPYLAKINNKFTPLEDGELKDKLTALLDKYGYKIKEIKVMDASKRTTKSNAYFAGFGKSKSIVLYDNIINALLPDEICAVFSHELGHGLHKDTLKNSIASLFNILIIAACFYMVSSNEQIYYDFNFYSINYGLAYFLLGEVVLGFVSPFIGIFINLMSRKAEYRADHQAVKDGYGDALVSALKKISKENFGNMAPNKFLVILEYNHPTLSDRIARIENIK